MLPSPRSMMKELERMRSEMDRIWERFSTGVPPSRHEREWVPPVDLAEIEDRLVAEIEVPGVSPEEIDIVVTEQKLTISGEKSQQTEAEEPSYHLSERSYGKFSRSIVLPAAVDPNRVEAAYRDGVLRVTMGKTEKTRSKKIEVKTA